MSYSSEHTPSFTELWELHAINQFPNCHGNTSRIYVKWSWIYLMWLCDSKIAVRMV